MADDAQEKTEKATPRREGKAREEGQVPRSKDLSTTTVLVLGTIGLLIFGPMMSERMSQVFRFNFNLEREAIFDTTTMFEHMAASLYSALFSIMPFMALVLFASIIGPVMVGGWLFSTKALQPKFNRLDPIAGLKRMFSLKSLVELVKSIGKILVIVGCAFLLLAAMQADILGLSQEGIKEGMVRSVLLSVYAAIGLAASTILLIIIDVPYQIWQHAKQLRMSRQEIKDEVKDTEGKPEVKRKIRQKQMEMAQQRMMSAVPDADVVITNPTHYAVALKYDPNNMETPILLAKGIDHLALKIRLIAKEHKIEQIESPVLARAIYYTTDLEREIPEGLYVAVAQVLAYVFQLREYRRGQGERPFYPRKLDIPPSMSHY